MLRKKRIECHTVNCINRIQGTSGERNDQYTCIAKLIISKLSMKTIKYQSGTVYCVSLMQHQSLKCDFAISYIGNMIMYIPIISHLENILLYNIKMN